jgi:nucleoside-diphosphate-sugar epimerase
MKTLVLGASGATGRLVVQQLLQKNARVRMVVREAAIVPAHITDNRSVEIVRGTIDDFNPEKMSGLTRDCDSVICCLGHNITFKGMFGHPRKLVANAVEKVVRAMQNAGTKKLILMSTTAYTNKKDGETNPIGERIIFALLEALLPPHTDNMRAADHLVYTIGSDDSIEWVAVRPDSLFDEEAVSEYVLWNRKQRSPIFDPGRTSRINVSHFMAELLVNDRLWQEWKFKTPVIYNMDKTTQAAG